MSLPAPGPNQALEPTPYSLRCASASGRGSPPAFGLSTESMSDTLIVQRKAGGE
jgi:hypothetical protein